MTADHVAVLVAAAAAAVAAFVLVGVVVVLGRRVRQLGETVEELRRETVPLVRDARVVVDQAATEMVRVGDVLELDRSGVGHRRLGLASRLPRPGQPRGQGHRLQHRTGERLPPPLRPTAGVTPGAGAVIGQRPRPLRLPVGVSARRRPGPGPAGRRPPRCAPRAAAGATPRRPRDAPAHVAGGGSGAGRRGHGVGPAPPRPVVAPHAPRVGGHRDRVGGGPHPAGRRPTGCVTRRRRRTRPTRSAARTSLWHQLSARQQAPR